MQSRRFVGLLVTASDRSTLVQQVRQQMLFARPKGTPVAMAFDPEHNAAVLFDFGRKTVWAYRLDETRAGTKVDPAGK